MDGTPPSNLHQSASGLDDMGFNARVFLHTAYSIEDYNAHRLFIELTRIPSKGIIEQYVANDLVHRWVPVTLPSSAGVFFYRIDIHAYLSLAHPCRWLTVSCF